MFAINFQLFRTSRAQRVSFPLFFFLFLAPARKALAYSVKGEGRNRREPLLQRPLAPVTQHFRTASLLAASEDRVLPLRGAAFILCRAVTPELFLLLQRRTFGSTQLPVGAEQGSGNVHDCTIWYSRSIFSGGGARFPDGSYPLAHRRFLHH